MEMAKISTEALDGIDESTRWTIANALRVAAERFEDNSKYFVDHPAARGAADLAKTFSQQALDARDLAEQFENC